MCLMRRHFLSIALVMTLLPAAPGRAKSPRRTGPAVSDPSLVPLYVNDTIPEYRWRAYGDIDGDGIDDLVLSRGFSELSQNGVTLFIYFGDSTGQYVFYDTTYGTPADLCFERDHRGIRLWDYWHRSASEGNIGYARLTDSGLVRGGGMTIYGGDGGTEIGRSIYDAVFDNCDVYFRVEKYRIVDGKVEIAKK